MNEATDSRKGNLRGAVARLALALALTAGLISAAAALAADTQLNFVECVKATGSGQTCSKTATGLNQAIDVATSPDGRSVYVVSEAGESFGPGALDAFSRDPSTGALNFVQTETQGVSGVDGLESATDVTVSSDGKSVYVASRLDDEIAVFSRNTATGGLTFVEAESGGPSETMGIVTSPDGSHVYANSSNALATYSRNPTTGALTFVECLNESSSGGCSDNGGTVDGVNFTRKLAISADGKNVYVTGYFSLATFARNSTSGKLGFVDVETSSEAPLSGANGVTVSLDGKNVYATADGSNSGSGGVDAVLAFARNSATGALSFIEAEQRGLDVNGNGAAGVTVSPDDAVVYVASGFSASGHLVAFSREPATGALTFSECLQSTGGSSPSPDCSTKGDTVYGIKGADGVAISPDGGSVYVAGTGGGVGVFAVVPAGAGGGGGSGGDTEVTDPDVTIAKKITVKGKELKVKVSAGAQEMVTAKGKGSVVVQSAKKGGKGGKKGRAKGVKKTDLKPVTKTVEGGERTILRLKYKGSKKKRQKLTKKLIKSIKRGKKATARIQVTFTDAAGNTATEKRVSRLKVKGKKGGRGR